MRVISVGFVLIICVMLVIIMYAFPFPYQHAELNKGIVAALDGEQFETNMTGMGFSNFETEMTGNYTILVEENGNALVNLTIDGSGTMNLPLPLDVVSPNVDGALYIQAPNGVDISVGSSRHVGVIYPTSLLTTKLLDLWNFEMELPKFGSASVFISMPKNIEITQTSPHAWITQTRTSTNVLWKVIPEGSDTITLQYRFVQPSLTPTPSPTPSLTPPIKETTMSIENESENQTKQIFEWKSLSFPWKNFVLPGVLVFGLSFAMYYFIGKNEPLIPPTEGIANVMKTLTENEHTIVDMLLQNDGEIKRNKLEKTSDLAKSSLASSLYRLEQRNIVEVDKSRAIHYIKLTRWFRSL